MRKKIEERRKPIICPNCGHKMVCMNSFESIYQQSRGFYAWYVCPRRKREGGCDYSLLLEVSPKSKRPRRTVIAFQLKRPVAKKKAKR